MTRTLSAIFAASRPSALLVAGLTIAPLHAATPAEIFGFEDASAWTVSSGEKTSSTDRSQGAKSLGVAKTYWAEVVSAPTANHGTPSAEMLLDVNAPVGTSWGQVQLVAHAPSVGIYEQMLGQFDASALTKGSFTTLRFTVPASTEAALKQASSVTYKIRFGGPWSATPWKFDHLRFASTAGTFSKVEIRTPVSDDIVYLVVNGQRHRVGYWGMDAAKANNWRDVSHLFLPGTNDVRLRAFNSGGPGAVHFEIRVDEGPATVVTCPSTTCDASATESIFLDQVVSLPALSRPAAQAVTITSQSPGKLYVNDEYTGLTTPTTITLPQGAWTLGVGTGNDNPSFYQGYFHEKNVIVGTSPITVDMQTNTVPLPVRNFTKIAVLPIQTITAPDIPAPGILQPHEGELLGNQLRATSSGWFQPFSYGLAAWDVTVQPLVTDWVGQAPSGQEMIGTACTILEDSRYAGLLSQYDIVVVTYGEKDAAGNHFFGGSGGISTGQCVSIPSTAYYQEGITARNELALHEILHQFEDGQVNFRKHYNGTQGLHGAEEHGFYPGTNGEPGWVGWYRLFVRGQAGEVSSMRPEAHIPAPLQNPAYHVGTWHSVKNGRRVPAVD